MTDVQITDFSMSSARNQEGQRRRSKDGKGDCQKNDDGLPFHEQHYRKNNPACQHKVLIL